MMECNFSRVTERYLSRFHKILNEMIEGMTSARLCDSISYNFIVQMIPHHKAAIEMSENILRYTTDIPLQDIACRIIEEQTKSIENMCDIKSCCSRCRNSEKELRLYQERVSHILHTMFDGMRQAHTDNDINADFMREMIPHHQGAIEMSENALSYEICSGLHPILHAIITSQEQGIRRMRRLLDA